MNDLHWKEQLRKNLEYAKQGKPKIAFNANLYDALLLHQNQNPQAVAFKLKAKAGGKLMI